MWGATIILCWRIVTVVNVEGPVWVCTSPPATSLVVTLYPCTRRVVLEEWKTQRLSCYRSDSEIALKPVLNKHPLFTTHTRSIQYIYNYIRYLGCYFSLFPTVWSLFTPSVICFTFLFQSAGFGQQHTHITHPTWNPISSMEHSQQLHCWDSTLITSSGMTGKRWQSKKSCLSSSWPPWILKLEHSRSMNGCRDTLVYLPARSLIRTICNTLSRTS